jgi:hypothetical protein
MTDRGGLSIYALRSPLPNDNLNSTDIYLDQFYIGMPLLILCIVQDLDLKSILCI